MNRMALRELAIARNILSSGDYIEMARESTWNAFYNATNLSDRLDSKSIFRKHVSPVVFDFKNKVYRNLLLQGGEVYAWEPEKAPNGDIITQPTVLEIKLNLFVNFDWISYLKNDTIRGGDNRSLIKYAKQRFFENVYKNNYLNIIKFNTERVINDWEKFFNMIHDNRYKPLSVSNQHPMNRPPSRIHNIGDNRRYK